MGPIEYLVGQIFGHLGVAFTRGWLTDLKLGHLGVQIFGRLRKQPKAAFTRGRPNIWLLKYSAGPVQM